MPELTRTSSLAKQHYLNATWLIKLRWVAVIGQLVTITGAIFLFQTRIPMAWSMTVVISLTAVSNLFLTIWFRKWKQIDERRPSPEAPLPWDLILGLILIMDMLSLTALLFTTGGPNNPFFLFFFVNLSLCAFMLNRQWAWAINGLTIVCFAGLIVGHHELPQLDVGLQPLSATREISMKVMGLFVAFATCSSVIVYFVTRLTDELREHQQELRRAQELQANSEKIEALGTLAAGTAHELATPLSTIAIVARDVEQAFEKHPPDFPGAEDVIEDVSLIRSQLDRCRRIINRMASHAGAAIGEQIESVTIEQISNGMLEEIIGRGRIQLKLSPATTNARLDVPPVGLAQAMRGLVQNAIDADSSDRPVFVDVSKDGKFWKWQIRDEGHGMTPEQLKRVSEPFYTTKPPGEGMGLGVFLAKNVVRRLGGSIEIESTPNQGTSVTVFLPTRSPFRDSSTVE